MGIGISYVSIFIVSVLSHPFCYVYTHRLSPSTDSISVVQLTPFWIVAQLVNPSVPSPNLLELCNCVDLTNVSLETCASVVWYNKLCVLFNCLEVLSICYFDVLGLGLQLVNMIDIVSFVTCGWLTGPWKSMQVAVRELSILEFN